jgi:hypothetical protein
MSRVDGGLGRVAGGTDREILGGCCVVGPTSCGGVRTVNGEEAAVDGGRGTVDVGVGTIHGGVGMNDCGVGTSDAAAPRLSVPADRMSARGRSNGVISAGFCVARVRCRVAAETRRASEGRGDGGGRGDRDRDRVRRDAGRPTPVSTDALRVNEGASCAGLRRTRLSADAFRVRPNASRGDPAGCSVDRDRSSVTEDAS